MRIIVVVSRRDISLARAAAVRVVTTWQRSSPLHDAAASALSSFASGDTPARRLRMAKGNNARKKETKKPKKDASAAGNKKK
jgi:D-arabinose 5-phosphate isomerase GutQ